MANKRVDLKARAAERRAQRETKPKAQAREFTPEPALPPGITGTLPRPMGQPILDASTLTKREREALEAEGWQPGKEAPVESEAIARERARLQKEIEEFSSKVGENAPPLEIPEEIQWEQLDKETQKRMMAEINEGYKQTNATQQRNPLKGPSVEVYDSRETVRIGNPVKEVETPPEKDEEPVEEHTEEDKEYAGSSLHDGNCPHCGWQLDRSDVEIDENDKIKYVLAQCGGSEDGRFRKEYSVFNNHMSITFRDLTSKESDLIYKQLASDRLQERITAPDDYIYYFMSYRLICSLERIEKSGEGQPTVLPVIEDYDVEGKYVTPLPEILDYLMDTVIKTETFKRLLINKLSEFQRMVEQLEARAEDDDFFPKTSF